MACPTRSAPTRPWSMLTSGQATESAPMKRQIPVIALCAVLAAGLFAPLLTGASALGFWLEVLLGGLMAGVLYSLVALGFVLIFKASGVFNFAQGAMVLFAALTVARLAERMPLWLAILLAIAIMVVLAILIERLVLRPLVGQEAVALLMATLGLSYFLRSEEHTSELQSQSNLVCRLLLEKKNDI